MQENLKEIEPKLFISKVHSGLGSSAGRGLQTFPLFFLAVSPTSWTRADWVAVGRVAESQNRVKANIIHAVMAAHTTVL